jgi:3-oxoacyl-[acyl-carrier protein] reductase
MPDSTQNRVVLVTGAGKGAGRAVALAFATRGDLIAANDITPINLDDTLETIAAAGGRAQGYVADVAKKMPLQATIEQVLADWGRLDILVTNARVAPQATILEMDEWALRRTIEVNLTANFLALQSAGRVMREAGGGAIVLLIGAQHAGDGPQAAYQVSTAALDTLALAAAQELWPFGVRVHAVHTQDKSQEAICQVVLDLTSAAPGFDVQKAFDPERVLVK